MFSAAGILGSPGIVIIFPAKTTINPAPDFNSIFLTWILYSPLHSKFLGSSEKEYCVLAIHIGNFPYPNSSIFLISDNASSEYSTDFAPYILLATFSILFVIESSKSYM